MNRVRELSDQVVAQAKQNGLAWLEGYERVVESMLDLEEQAQQDRAAAAADCRAAIERMLDLHGASGSKTTDALQRAWRDVAVGNPTAGRRIHRRRGSAPTRGTQAPSGGPKADAAWNPDTS